MNAATVGWYLLFCVLSTRLPPPTSWLVFFRVRSNNVSIFFEIIELVNLPVVLILLVTEGDMKELMASGRGVYFLVGVNFVIFDVNDAYVFS